VGFGPACACKNAPAKIGRVRAQAEPQRQRAIDWLLGLLDESDNFHCTALARIESLLDVPHDEVLRRLAQKVVAERQDLARAGFLKFQHEPVVLANRRIFFPLLIHQPAGGVVWVGVKGKAPIRRHPQNFVVLTNDTSARQISYPRPKCPRRCYVLTM
jgi:hypothetical protein